jgi:hypothetical protein
VSFDPFRTAGSNLIGDPDAIQVPIMIYFEREFLTTRMFDRLIDAMNTAAIRTDLELYDEVMGLLAQPDSSARGGYEELQADPNRFLITSISRGSVIVSGTILLGIGWAIKKLLGPGWEMSETKKHWDEGVAHVIDKSAHTLGENITRVSKRLGRRLRITRMSMGHDEGERKALSVTMGDHHRLEHKQPGKE